MFPITGTIYFFGSLIMFFLGWRFLRYGKKENNKIAKFFGYGFLLLVIHRFFLAIPSLIFLENQRIWLIFELISRIAIVSALVTFGYIIYYIKFPKQVRKITIFFAIVALTIVISTIFFPPYYFFKNGVLNWQPSLLPSILTFLLAFIIAISGAILFFQEATATKDREAKMRSIGLGLVPVWFLISGTIDLLLTRINQLYSDINFAVGVIILLLILILTYPVSKKT